MDPIGNRIVYGLSEEVLIRLLLSKTNNSADQLSKLKEAYQEEIRRRIEEQFSNELFTDSQISQVLRADQPVYIVFTYDNYGDHHPIWYHTVFKDKWKMMSYHSFDYHNQLIYSRQYRSISLTTQGITLLDKGGFTSAFQTGTRRFFAKSLHQSEDD